MFKFNMFVPAILTALGIMSAKVIASTAAKNELAPAFKFSTMHGSGYSSMDYGSIYRAHRNNRRGKIIKRYRHE